MRIRDRARLIASAPAPRLRGWQHAIAAPIAGLATLGLVTLAPDRLRLPLLVFATTTVLLFTVSAIYHRGRWSPRTKAILQRWDHANIFIVIAGTGTPFAVALLPTSPARTLLALLWSGALGGATLRLLWIRAPKWLFVPLYLLLGWATVMFLPSFVGSDRLPPTAKFWVIGLISLGGLFYTLGAGVFATKWPNPWPRSFGFHEIFHSFTLGGWVAHFAAAAVVLGAVR